MSNKRANTIPDERTERAFQQIFGSRPRRSKRSARAIRLPVSASVERIVSALEQADARERAAEHED